MTPEIILKTVVYPAGAGAGLFIAGLALARLTRASGTKAPPETTPSPSGAQAVASQQAEQGGHDAFPRWLAPILVAAVVVVGARFILSKWPTFPIRVGEDWVMLFAVASGVLAAATTFLPQRLRVAAQVSLVVLGGLALLPAPLANAWKSLMGEGSARLLEAMVILASVIVPAVLVNRTERRAPPMVASAGVLAATSLGAGAMLMSGSAKLSQLEGLLGIAAGWLLLGAVLFRRWPAASAASVPLMVSHALLWTTTYYYASANVYASVLGLLAPGAAAAALLPGVSRLNPWIRAGLAALAAGGVAAASLVIALATREASPYASLG
ncbi:MAG: hypothetical protein SFZ23_07620 [Planctomycetota bacterium]|nr:hypothetical protein [Planctomycetota bacterium]